MSSSVSIPSDEIKQKPFSDWWWILLALPFVLPVQLMFVEWNHIIAPIEDNILLVFDGCIVLRAIYGLIFQSNSPDWKPYFLLLIFGQILILFATIPVSIVYKVLHL